MSNLEETSKPLPMVAIVYLAFEPAWLTLSRMKRGIYGEGVGAILANHPRVTFEWFDADALAGGYSDFAIYRFSDMRAYHYLWEELRDTEIFSKLLARITNVTIGIQNGFQDYEAAVGKQGNA
ncbi:MAG: darcynin family protein [Roseibium sp.]